MSLLYPDYFNDTFTVQPSDTLTLEEDSNNTKDYKFAALRVYGAADDTITVVTSEGTTQEFTLGGGIEYFPGQFIQVLDTGTTDTIEIIALVKK